MSTVLVTGGSGFLGGHCILQLLSAGHEVRTTIRNIGKEGALRATLGEPGGRLTVLAADLASDAGWSNAVAGCDYVLHVASPFPPALPKNEDELIVPAREGTLRVLRAARDVGVKRVVVTSSFAAIGYGHAPDHAPFTEADWSNLEGPAVTPYIKSKAIAERAAWDFIEREGNGLELAVINATAILGPLLGPDLSTSIDMVQQLMSGAMPGAPRLYFNIVDVRDCADLHLRAMTNPAAKGERFLALAGDCMSLIDLSRALRQRLGDGAKRTPRFQLPDWLVRLAATRNPALSTVAPSLGKIRRASNEKARRLLGWAPRSNEDAVVATAESLLRLGLVKV